MCEYHTFFSANGAPGALDEKVRTFSGRARFFLSAECNIDVREYVLRTLFHILHTSAALGKYKYVIYANAKRPAIRGRCAQII